MDRHTYKLTYIQRGYGYYNIDYDSNCYIKIAGTLLKRFGTNGHKTFGLRISGY